MGRQLIGIGIGIIVIVVALVLLRPGPATNEEPGHRRLVVSSRLWSQPHERQFVLESIIGPFEREQNCTVELQVFDDVKQLQRMKVQQTSDTVGTDVAIVYVSRMANWVEDGLVVDLRPYETAWEGRSFVEAFESMTTFAGKRYFLPIGADDYLLCANREALKYLPEGLDAQNLSWHQLVQWARRIAEGEGEGKFAVTGVAQKMLIYQVSAAILSYGGGFPDVASPEAILAWRVLTGLHGALTPAVGTYDTVVPAMKRGEAWLTVTHNARVGEIHASNPTQYVVAPAPHGPAGRGSVAGVSGVGIVRGAGQPELAAAFLGYLTRPDIQMKLAIGTGGFIPTVTEAVKELGDSVQEQVIAKSMQVLEEGNLAYIPAVQNWSSVKIVYDEAFRKVVMRDGEVDVEYLRAAQETIDTFR